MADQNGIGQTRREHGADVTKREGAQPLDEQDVQQQVGLARRGDEQAFLRLMKHMELRLYRIASAMVKRQEDVLDVMQETVIKAYESLPQLREAIFFETWIIRILINECNHVLRKRQRVIPFSDIRPTVNIAVGTYDDVDMRQVVDQLEEDKRQLIILHYFQDIPLKQVADILGITESTAKTRLHRTRKLLSRWIGGEDEEGRTHENR